MTLRLHDRFTHKLNPQLGPGQVTAVERRRVSAYFPRTGQTIQLAADPDIVEPFVLEVGTPVLHLESGRTSTIAALLEGGRVRLADGSQVEGDELWPEEPPDDLRGRLERGAVDSREAFELRLDLLRLEALRQADGLGSFLGGRIRLYPHQLYVAEQATGRDPVRWLLADEVGLGKTVESCLILNHLVRTGRAESALVVAPETLTVQWLGELWRKYHQVFVLLDEKRLQDVEKDFGAGFNPFDAHQFTVVSQELLAERPKLVEQAIESGIDLLVVDEAHRLRRRPGHPGNAEYRALQPLTESAAHLLLLTAVPLEDDVHGFYRLLELLHGDAFSDFTDFEAALEAKTALPRCTTATRRVDIGGLPPRSDQPVDLADDDAFAASEKLLDTIHSRRPGNAAQKRRKAVLLRRAASSPAALSESLPESDDELRRAARAAAALDPRVTWLSEQLPKWQAVGEKTLVFVAERDALESLKRELGERTAVKIGTFHEEMSSKQRDIEVAQFRLEDGPSVLISTECGGEGRNFEFCARLVLFDLPWSPMVVEQRIGRLDRIGRDGDVRVVWFRPPRGIDALVGALFERLGLFERPLTSLERELRDVEGHLEQEATRAATCAELHAGRLTNFETILDDAERGARRIERAAYAALHRDPYSARLAAPILARVPEPLEALTQEVVLGSCWQLGMSVEEHADGARHWIELDSRARVESLPFVGAEGSFLGTFSRERAVEDETIDYFASGHPLVEGLLAHMDESSMGRAVLLDLRRTSAKSEPGLAAIYAGLRGPRIDCWDVRGNLRPEWSDRFFDRPLKGPYVKAERWVTQTGWAKLVEALTRHLDPADPPQALAILRAN